MVLELELELELALKSDRELIRLSPSVGEDKSFLLELLDKAPSELFVSHESLRSRRYFPTLKILTRFPRHVRYDSSFLAMKDFPRPGKPTNTKTNFPLDGPTRVSAVRVRSSCEVPLDFCVDDVE